HSIPAHGPATVFMTTGNRPTPALHYPSLGSLVNRLMPAAAGVPPFISFSEMRNGTAGLAGYLGTAYNPSIVEGVGAGNANPAAAGARRRHTVRPGRPRRTPADRGGRALRHREPGRLGHARPELQHAAHPPLAAARPDAVGPGRGSRHPRVA